MKNLVNKPIDNAEKLENEVFLCNHDLNKTGLFTDEQLIKIFETHPEDYMQIYTMGDDHGDLDDFRLGYRGDTNSAKLLEKVKQGRLWFNIKEIEKFHPEYKEIVDQLFEELRIANPAFETYDRTATLLVSSPNAKVYYHADGPPNILWHIRGRKKVSLYPLTEKFAPQLEIEKIFTGESNDDLSYDLSYDDEADDFVLDEGEMIAWPQNMPHRVDNLDSFCVSLSIEYYSEKSSLKEDTFLANYYLREWLKLPCYGTATKGLVPSAKRLLFRALSKLPLKEARQSEDVYEFSLSDK